MAETKGSTLRKFADILRFEKDEIFSVYFYAILSGLVQLSLPLGIQSIISFMLGGAISTSLVLLIIFVIIGVFVFGLLQVNQMKIIEKIQQQLFVRYSFQYAHVIPRLNLSEVNNYYLPELVNRFTDTISLQKGISKLLLDIPAASIQILFGLILLSFYHPVFIVFGVSLLLILYFILAGTGNRGMQTSLEESDYKYKVLGYLQELARVVTTFKFSRNSTLHLNRTDEYVTGYLKARTAHFKILLFQYWALVAFKVLITAAMLIVGGILVVNQQLNIGQFIAAEIVILMVLGSVEKLIVNLDKVYDVMTSVEKITKVTEKPLEETAGAALETGAKGLAVQVQNLTFGYNGGPKVLRDISITVAPGEKVCVLGPNSAGKSTLLRVMSGAYPIEDGNLFINNVPVTNYDQGSLRAHIGVLLQVQDIFLGSLEENITLGDGSISYEQMDELAAIVGLKPFVDASRMGYKMQLQPMGQHLSGKIIKKILLVRALIHKPKLLLLEEPWLGMEDMYAEQIKNYLLQLNNATVVVVTNDSSFAQRCNKSMTLEGGRITRIN